MEERNKKITKLNWEINRYINSNTKDGLSQALQLQSAWEKIAPPVALENTDNIAYSTKTKKTEILVFVDNSHWAAELESQKELYRILMERELKKKVSDIRFLVTRKAAYKKAFKKWRERNPATKPKERAVPLTKEEDRHARLMVSVVKDEKLRNVLYKAMKADLEWKKGTGGIKMSENPLESPETI